MDNIYSRQTTQPAYLNKNVPLNGKQLNARPLPLPVAAVHLAVCALGQPSRLWPEGARSTSWPWPNGAFPSSIAAGSPHKNQNKDKDAHKKEHTNHTLPRCISFAWPIFGIYSTPCISALHHTTRRTVLISADSSCVGLQKPFVANPRHNKHTQNKNQNCPSINQVRRYTRSTPHPR